MLEGVLSRFQEHAYALMRIFFGLLFAFHGAQKLFGVFGGKQVSSLFELIAVAGIIEFFGGLLIALGLLTRAAALLATAEMAVAYYMAHASQGIWPIVNRGELACLYFFGFLLISTRGTGIWGLKGLFSK